MTEMALSSHDGSSTFQGMQSDGQESDAKLLIKELKKLSLKSRLAAVAKDVRERTDRFRVIEAHDLATLLGVDSAWEPDDSWSFTTYAKRVRVEDADESPEEWVYTLEGKVKPSRFAELEALATAKGSKSKRVAARLTDEERKIVEAALTESSLQGNLDNGIGGVANISVCAGSITLSFEGDIEDDGACISLRTPYDHRDGAFVDLTDCATESW